MSLGSRLEVFDYGALFLSENDMVEAFEVLIPEQEIDFSDASTVLKDSKSSVTLQRLIMSRVSGPLGEELDDTERGRWWAEQWRDKQAGSPGPVEDSLKP